MSKTWYRVSVDRSGEFKPAFLSAGSKLTFKERVELRRLYEVQSRKLHQAAKGEGLKIMDLKTKAQAERVVKKLKVVLPGVPLAIDEYIYCSFFTI